MCSAHSKHREKDLNYKFPQTKTFKGLTKQQKTDNSVFIAFIGDLSHTKTRELIPQSTNHEYTIYYFREKSVKKKKSDLSFLFLVKVNLSY